MTGVLLRKEFRQHGVWFAILLVITWGLFLLVTLASLANGMGGGTFFGIGQGLIFLLIIPVYILGHLLVAMEFRNRTRLFLEALPLSRFRLVGVKAFLALAIGTLMALGGVVVGIAISGGAEALSLKFAGILISSAVVWASFLVSVCFFISFLGRYKVAVILVLFFGLAWLADASPVPLTAFPPFGLIQRFGFERDVWPVEQLWQTGAFTVAFFAAAFVIGLAKEGSVAALLGEAMTYREKMLLGAGLAVAFFMISPWLEQKSEPFRIPGAVEETHEGVQVFVSPEELDRPVDEEIALASLLARRLAEKRDWLGIPPEDFPVVYIVEHSGLEDEMIDWETLPDDRAVLMYAGYREEGFSNDKLFAYTMSVSLSAYTNERASRENRWWIVCGIEGLWEMETADEAAFAAREKVAFDTIEEHGFSVERLMGRALYSDEAGWREADAVAWMAFRYLVETVGMEKVQTLARETVTDKVMRKDSRPVWRELLRSVPTVFKKTTGLSLEEFVAGARAFIEAHPGAEAESESADEKGEES